MLLPAGAKQRRLLAILRELTVKEGERVRGAMVGASLEVWGYLGGVPDGREEE